MRTRTQLLLALSLVFMLVGTVLLLSRWPQHPAVPVTPPAPVRQTMPAVAPAPAEAADLSRRGDTKDHLTSSLAALRTARDAQDSRRILAELRSQLSGLSPQAASTALRQFLDAGLDAPTHLDFVLGPDGFLKDPSSLRVFLLDYLAQVDGASAAAYAQKILGAMNSPDEWAVSLRNYALVNSSPEAKAFLQAKVRDMISHQPWQQDPSTGFLEAFDVAVYAGGTVLVPQLSDLLRQTDNRAVAHAAYLALDRLVLEEPGAVLKQLVEQPELMTGREQTRANYFARANVTDAEQRQLLEAYLLNPALTGAELEAFTGLFPNANQMISNNLLTRTATPTRETLVRHDRQALQTVEAWLAEPRFARLKPQLERVRNRLAEFVKQAGGPP